MNLPIFNILSLYEAGYNKALVRISTKAYVKSSSVLDELVKKGLAKAGPKLKKGSAFRPFAVSVPRLWDNGGKNVLANGVRFVSYEQNTSGISVPLEKIYIASPHQVKQVEKNIQANLAWIKRFRENLKQGLSE